VANISELKALVSAKLGFARSNNFLVKLPSTVVNTAPSSFIVPGEINLLCKNVSLPGKQVLTLDRRIGMRNEKIGYGYGVTDAAMTFYLLNDYGIKKYFDDWLKYILDETTGEVNWKNYYAKSIEIHQLRKPLLGGKIDAGPAQINLSLGAGSVYSVELVEAFPTTINEVALTNDLDGLSELTVNFSYTRWKIIDNPQNFIDVDIGI